MIEENRPRRPTGRAWVTGMRGEDAPTRSDIQVLGWDAKRGMVKLNPLAAWTQAGYPTDK